MTTSNRSLAKDDAPRKKRLPSIESEVSRISPDEQGILLTQYGVAAEQIHHQDTLSWQTFSFTLGINGIGIVALATIGTGAFTNPITILVSIVGLASCLFGTLHVFRAIRYQEHVYGVAKEIEARLSSSVNLFTFNPNSPHTYSPMSKFYDKSIYPIVKVSARKVWALSLLGVAVGWLTISIIVISNLV